MKRGKSRKPENLGNNAGPHVIHRGIERILASIADDPRSADDHIDRAQQIVYDAWEEESPARRAMLAKRALEVSPDCADAYVLLAEEVARSAREALDFCQKGVAAGERAIGKENFERYRGHFWGVLETRPYMRARAGVGQALWALGRRAEALDHYRAMLELNPNDNQGIRDVLLCGLLDLKLDEEAMKLLEAYRDDVSATWAYSGALLAFRKTGDTPHSKKLLRGAIKRNRFVPDYLLGKKKIPKVLDDLVGFGDESEARAYAGDNISAWRTSYGALKWLWDVVGSSGKARR